MPYKINPYNLSKKQAEEANRRAYAKSSEQARLEGISDNFNEVGNSFLWNLPGSISPMAAEELLLSGAGKGLKYLKNTKAGKKVFDKAVEALIQAKGKGLSVEDAVADALKSFGKESTQVIPKNKYVASEKRLVETINKQKPLELPSALEIDWGKRYPEIPGNKALMEEYAAIERQAKTNGTWMKNPDGSKFMGLPEQFVQQRSKNFKNAFGESGFVSNIGEPLEFFHGTRASEFPKILKSPKAQGDAFKHVTATNPRTEHVFFTPTENVASNWGSKGSYKGFYINSKNPHHVDKFYGQIANPAAEFNKTPAGRDAITNTQFGIGKFDPTITTTTKGNNNFISDASIGLRDNRISEVAIPTGTNYPKATIGNNGMFDMTNPNIYKAVAAPIGLGTVLRSTSTPRRRAGGILYKK